jgi:hypothetical protein
MVYAIMLNVIMVNVIMLAVVMLNVIVPHLTRLKNCKTLITKEEKLYQIGPWSF